MIRPTLSLLFVAVLVMSAIWGQFARNGLVTEQEVSAHLRFLASDELRGRRTGTPGNSVASRYIAEQFRKDEVLSLPALGSYFQELILAARKLAGEGSLTLGAEQLQTGADLLILAGGPVDLEAELVWLSSPTEEPTANVAEKIVAYQSEPDLRQADQNRETLQKRGAAGIIELVDGDQWERIYAILSDTRIQLLEEVEEAIPHLLINDKNGTRIREWGQRPPPRATISLPSGAAERLEARNVIGWIPGSDNQLKEQFLLLTAHYDHLGAGDNLPGAEADDSIFNGAIDNAMGVTALLATGRILAASPPPRSVLLMATTAEEMGLLGSAYYVRHPVVPLEKTVFVLNADGGGLADRDVVTVIGLERTTAGPHLEAACAEFGLTAIPSPADGPDLFDRSDNISFARHGIPALTFSPGFRQFDQDTLRHYHRPSDEADDRFDFDYLLRYSLSYAAAARRIASQPETPAWVPKDPYARQAQALYGKAQPAPHKEK